MEFNPMHFVDNLSYMGIGMLGVFVAMGVIVVTIILMNRFTKKGD